MLEVFAVIGLCRLNRKNAIARGRRPGGYIALTIILWILFEFVGAIFGILLFGRDNDTFTVMFVADFCVQLLADLSRSSSQSSDRAATMLIRVFSL